MRRTNSKSRSMEEIGPIKYHLLTISKLLVRDLWSIRLDALADRMDVNPISDSESESQMFSSQSDDTGSSSDGTSVNSRAINPSATPKLIHTVALCYVAAQILRAPIFIGDFLKWMRQGDLLYYRAIKEIPQDILVRLPGQYHPFLDSQDILDSNVLYHAVTSTYLLFQKDVDMKFQRLNFPLYMWRCLHDLVLPIEIYSAFKHVAALAPCTFTIPEEMRGRNLRVNDFPEGQFVACLVIAVKLMHPFDSIKRYPTENDDPGGAVMDWSVWAKAMEIHKRDTKSGERLDWDEAMRVTEDDMFKMTNTEIDDYLDYYTKTWTIEDPDENNKDADFRKAMLDLFPVPNGKQAATTTALTEEQLANLSDERSKKVQEGMIQRRTITMEQERENDMDIERPGGSYRRYKKVADITGHAKVFYEAVAELSGLSLRSVVRAVYLTEARLQLRLQEEELLEQFGPRPEGKGKERAN